jgi:DNA replication and repair protein RecF
MSFLTQLTLQNFRCYEQIRLSDIDAGLIVLCGPNGAGKTNILEAVSLLTAGRGIRGVSAIDMQRHNAPQSWGISGRIDTGGSEVTLGTALNADTKRRMVRINGVDAKSQNALLDYMACLWLTPQMDRLFIEAASGRRKFLDRLIFTFDSGHSGRVTRYENALRQRSKILQDDNPDASWLDGLEAQMAETGVAIAAARRDFTERLQNFCVKMNEAENSINNAKEDQYFPKAILTAKGTLEELLGHSPAVEVEKIFAHQLVQSRRRDALVGGATTGPHKSDLDVFYKTKNMPAAQCSTGEQKALLISIVLSHSRMMAAERGAPPVLLLDEIAAHLDEERRAALFDHLESLGGQVWMTGTDTMLFEKIQQKAQFFDVNNAQITRQEISEAA